MTEPLISIGGKGTVGDLIGGSWTISESATPVDILDTNGSLGSISATFKNNPQGVANTPTTTPASGSAYVHGQPCTFTHQTLGSITGNILTATPASSTVKIEMSTPLTALNFTATMPAFTDGQSFYSWSAVLPGGLFSASPVLDMVCDSSGNIWTTGQFAGSNGYTTKYDRFGNLLLSITHSAQPSAIGLDTSGNVYVCVPTTGIFKYNGTTGASISTVATPAGGVTFQRMVVDRSNNIWVATTDTAANAAIKQYSTSGTLVGAAGTFATGSFAGNGAFAQYVGMSIEPTAAGTDNVLVFNLAGGPNATQVGLFAQRMTGLTMVNQFQMGNGTWNTELGVRIGGDGYWNGSAGVTRAVTATGIWASPGNTATSGNTWADWIATSPAASLSLNGTGQQLGGSLAMDRNGFGYYVSVGSTVYVMAGGNMSGSQAIERYLGYAGYRGSVSYGINTPYAAITDTSVVFPGWTANVWSSLKELCARVNRMLTTDGTGIYIRRTDNRSDLYKFSIANRAAAPQVTEGQPGAQIINVTSQNVTGGTGPVDVYIASPTDSQFNVDVSGSTTTTIQANVWTTNIIQPSPTDVAIVQPNPAGGGGYTGNMSVYGVVDSSNPPLRVPAATWTANGGAVTVAQSPTTAGGIDVTVVGPIAIAGFTGPFSIGYLSGSTKLGGLILRGWGCSINPSNFVAYTGAPINLVQQLNSSNLNSVFLDTMTAAWNAARFSATSMAGGEMSCQVDIPISDITVGFGKAVGGYFFWKRNYWRVTDISYKGGWATLTAVRDTRAFDVQDGTITHGTIDTTWSGFRYQDNYLSPGILGE